MTNTEQVAKIDDSLAGAHLVLLNLAHGQTITADSPVLAAAIADLEAARELLHELVHGTGAN